MSSLEDLIADFTAENIHHPDLLDGLIEEVEACVMRSASNVVVSLHLHCLQLNSFTGPVDGLFLGSVQT